MKWYSVRVEVFVDAPHPDAACAQVDRLMEPVRSAQWLIIFADGDKEEASQGTVSDGLKRYVVRVQVYVEAGHPDIAREQVTQLMDPVHGAPWRIRYIRGATPTDHQMLDEKYAASDGKSADIP